MTDISYEARKTLISVKNRIWGGPEEWVILENHVPHIWNGHRLSWQLVLLPSPAFVGQFLKWEQNLCDKKEKNSYIKRKVNRALPFWSAKSSKNSPVVTKAWTYLAKINFKTATQNVRTEPLSALVLKRYFWIPRRRYVRHIPIASGK